MQRKPTQKGVLMSGTAEKKPVIGIVRLPHGAGLELPAYETEGSAGMDLRAAIPEGERLTLKPGKRHIYKTRRFYLDEDSWRAIASDEYDGNGELYRGGFAHGSVDWYNRTGAGSGVIYDLIAGRYNASGIFGPFGGIKQIKPLSNAQWSPESLAGSGIR